MTWNYAYTPYIWPSFFTVLLLIALAVHAWQRRSIPGALPFMLACLFCVLWAAGAGLEAAAIDISTKVFWAKFQAAWQLPAITAVTCFILEYTWPGRWLTRRNLALLSIPCLLTLGMILTDDLNHLMWQGFAYDEMLIPLRSRATWMFVAYGYGLGILNLICLGWLFLRSPQHRWPVIVILTGQIGALVVYGLESARVIQSEIPLDVLAIALAYQMYAIALFGFRIFDPIPQARQTVIAQMHEGMLVLDPQDRVVDLNPAAKRILGMSAKRARGQLVRELLPAYPDEQLADTDETEIEISLGARQEAHGQEVRHYALVISLLKDWHRLVIGRLVLLRDVTEQKRAQAQLLEQQRALAMFLERERLARELHDGIGQVLGYVKMQAQAARDQLAQDQTAAADSNLEKLVAVAQDAHTDVREYLLGAKTPPAELPGFLPMLQEYLQRYSEQYGLRTKVIVPPEGIDGIFEPTVKAQLLRIIQEALTNARKHAQAQCVQVQIQLDGSCAQVIVQDDGLGFDPKQLVNGDGEKYGLGFMRQRAEEVGGSIEIQSAPGKGTQVFIEVPVKKGAAGKRSDA